MGPQIRIVASLILLNIFLLPSHDKHILLINEGSQEMGGVFLLLLVNGTGTQLQSYFKAKCFLTVHIRWEDLWTRTTFFQTIQY